MFALVPVVCGLLVPSLPHSLVTTTGRCAVRMSESGESDDPFDLGLLKLPKLTDPQRESFRRYRERQAERATRGSNAGKQRGAVPLSEARGPVGLDPVDGSDPVNLAELWGEGKEPEEGEAEDFEPMSPEDFNEP